MNPKQQSILLGGLVVGLLSTSYLGIINCLCCAGVILGGLTAVWHYTSTNALTVSQGEGASMGAIAGVIGAVVAFILNLVVTAIGFDAQEQLQQVWMDFFREQMSPDQLRQMEEQIASQSAFSFINLFVSLIVSAIFGTIGGVIGASVFKKGGAEPADEF